MKIKKLISIFIIITLLFGRISFPVVVLADEPPAAPTAPTAPQPPTAPEAPTAPQPPTAPEAPTAPSAPTAPTAPQPPTAPEAPTAPSAPEAPSETNALSTQNDSQGSTGITSNGNVDDTSINTGDANNNSSINTNGNNNLSAEGACCGGSTSISNTGNGAGSTNIGSSSSVTNNGTNQQNSATVSNNMNQSANTGGNDTSFNVGDSSISTGDANVTGTVVTSVNTNVDGVMVSEFNIVDDHMGDIILDFGTNCVAGCGQSLALANSGNGAFSYNEASSDSVINNNTNQTNYANVDNSITLVANSGYNDASFNTGGDSNITTGDANVSANSLTFANNNIAGNVIYGVVNIFGDLVGDIILTQEMMDALCGGTCVGSADLANSGNGAGSTNIADSNSTTNNNIFQSNDAAITNTLILDAETGNNDSNFNTDGNSSITTGDSSIDANILNVANMNLIGGNYWLVIVNEAGNWVGKIFGSDGTNFAGSPLFQFIVNPLTGGVTATNSDNGADSNNLAQSNSIVNNNINQSNTAVLNNTLNLSANTGGNDASYNTGGSSSIKTGDTNIVANIVNFVNNNIIGNGKLIVTVVNVFGSWLGDFLTPGSHKDNQTVLASSSSTSDNNPSSQENNQDNNSSNPQNNSSSNGSSNGSTTVAVAGVFAEKSPEQAVPIFAFTSHTGSVEVKVAGINVGNAVNKILGQSEEKDAVKINLAWALLLFPLAAGFIVIRKIYIKKLTALRVKPLGDAPKI